MPPLPLAIDSAPRSPDETGKTRRAVVQLEVAGSPCHPVTRIRFPPATGTGALDALARRLGDLLSARAVVEGSAVAVAGDHRFLLRSLLKRRGYRVRG